MTDIQQPEARALFEAHGIDTRNAPFGGFEICVEYDDGSWEWVRVPLSRETICDWLPAQ